MTTTIVYNYKWMENGHLVITELLEGVDMPILLHGKKFPYNPQIRWPTHSDVILFGTGKMINR